MPVFLHEKAQKSWAFPPNIQARLMRLVALLPFLCLSLRGERARALNIDERILTLAKTSLELSHFLFYNDTSLSPGPDAYELYKFYNALPSLPNQASLAKKDGRCFMTFQASFGLADWGQNLNPLKTRICLNETTRTQCCIVHKGFYNAYQAPYLAQLLTDLRSCAATCTRAPDDCVVLTGFSQGAAAASIAFFYLQDLQPIGIGEGHPSTFKLSSCPYIDTSRWYRFINSRTDQPGFKIVYDGLSMVPMRGLEHMGHLLVLSDDDTGLAYLGLDSQIVLKPWNVYYTHLMKSSPPKFPNPGYWNRITNILNAYTNTSRSLSFPVRLTGYGSGFPCSIDRECQSGQCLSLQNICK